MARYCDYCKRKIRFFEDDYAFSKYKFLCKECYMIQIEEERKAHEEAKRKFRKK